MTQYAPIAPIHVLSILEDKGLLGDYLLLLAHEVLAHPDAFADLRKRKPNAAIILDNSLIELGYALSVEQMHKAVEIVHPNYVVLPDVLGDQMATEAASKLAVHIWQDLEPRIDGFVIVAQGNTPKEAVNCVQGIHRYINSTKYAVIVSVPRVYTNTHGSRKEVIDLLAIHKYRKIHLLGFSSNYFDDLECARMSTVIGIDSATPLRLGWEGKTVPNAKAEVDPADNVLRPRDEYFECCRSVTDWMCYNLGAVRSAIQC